MATSQFIVKEIVRIFLSYNDSITSKRKAGGIAALLCCCFLDQTWANGSREIASQRHENHAEGWTRVSVYHTSLIGVSLCVAQRFQALAKKEFWV